MADSPNILFLMKLAWTYIRDTNDHTLLNSHDPILRNAPTGPLAIEE